MANLPLGVHLVTSRTGYTHHGIYIGNDQVVHYSGLADGLAAGPIEITSLTAFQGSGDLTVKTYATTIYAGTDAVHRALSRLGENEYDLQGNNCEHFCTWVKTGVRASQQVNSLENAIDIIPLTDLLVAGAKVRKHLVQGAQAGEIAKDVAGTAAKVAIAAVFPMAMPIKIGFSALRWVFGKL